MVEFSSFPKRMCRFQFMVNRILLKSDDQVEGPGTIFFMFNSFSDCGFLVLCAGSHFSSLVFSVGFLKVFVCVCVCLIFVIIDF